MAVINPIIFDAVYPVGSIYKSTNSTPPETLFGQGTWIAIHNVSLFGSGFFELGSVRGSKFLAAHKHPVAQFNTVTGGAHTHQSTFAVDQHCSGSTMRDGHPANNNYDGVRNDVVVGGQGSHTHSRTSVRTAVTGNGLVVPNSGDATSANYANMPPYLAVYMWERVE